MRIQIIGGSGTGKSTLGKWIGQEEGILWIDSDRYSMDGSNVHRKTDGRRTVYFI